MRVRTANDIGTYIRDQRRRQKLGQAELAERIGVSRRWITQIEQGKPRAELGLVLKALETLGIDLRVETHDAPATMPADSLESVDIGAIIRKARGEAV